MGREMVFFRFFSVPAWMLGLVAAVLMTAVDPLMAAAEVQGTSKRFFFSGDGRLHLVGLKSGHSFSGVYRMEDGTYDPAALGKIHKVFDAPADTPMAGIALRLIEFIDYLQDHFKSDARIEIASGWRDPTYNTKLQERGRLAATASLHQYGMAADIRIEGVASRRVWEYVRGLGFGGTGYYQGATVHVDVGPARFWDQKTSGVGTDISTDNKLVNLVADYDIYQPGNPVTLRFTRMTAFPIGVPQAFTLEKVGTSGEVQKTIAFQPSFGVDSQSPCIFLQDIGQMMNIRWTLPGDLPSGRYIIRCVFCDKEWEFMPAMIKTSEFEVR
jgi:uncharacterized protein YcbK (DUF882 family)